MSQTGDDPDSSEEKEHNEEEHNKPELKEQGDVQPKRSAPDGRFLGALLNPRRRRRNGLGLMLSDPYYYDDYNYGLYGPRYGYGPVIYGRSVNGKNNNKNNNRDRPILGRSLSIEPLPSAEARNTEESEDDLYEDDKSYAGEYTMRKSKSGMKIHRLRPSLIKKEILELNYKVKFNNSESNRQKLIPYLNNDDLEQPMKYQQRAANVNPPADSNAPSSSEDEELYLVPHQREVIVPHEERRKRYELKNGARDQTDREDDSREDPFNRDEMEGAATTLDKSGKRANNQNRIRPKIVPGREKIKEMDRDVEYSKQSEEDDQDLTGRDDGDEENDLENNKKSGLNGSKDSNSANNENADNEEDSDDRSSKAAQGTKESPDSKSEDNSEDSEERAEPVRPSDQLNRGSGDGKPPREKITPDELPDYDYKTQVLPKMRHPDDESKEETADNGPGDESGESSDRLRNRFLRRFRRDDSQAVKSEGRILLGLEERNASEVIPEEKGDSKVASKESASNIEKVDETEKRLVKRNVELNEMQLNEYEVAPGVEDSRASEEKGYCLHYSSDAEPSFVCKANDQIFQLEVLEDC